MSEKYEWTVDGEIRDAVYGQWRAGLDSEKMLMISGDITVSDVRREATRVVNESGEPFAEYAVLMLEAIARKRVYLVLTLNMGC